MATTGVLGATGMVGSLILSTLRSSPATSIASVDIIARRSPPGAASASSSVPLNEHVDKDTTKWASYLTAAKPSILFSSLATTRGAAGGFENQYKLEHDLNIELAKAAKAAGTKTYVLISSTGANTKSSVPYLKMKGEIEEHVKECDFDHTIILCPGLIAGKREESRPTEAIMRGLAAGLGMISSSLVDSWAQPADVIAKAAVHAALKTERGEVKEKVWVLHGRDIMRLGKHEWKNI